MMLTISRDEVSFNYTTVSCKASVESSKGKLDIEITTPDLSYRMSTTVKKQKSPIIITIVEDLVISLEKDGIISIKRKTKDADEEIRFRMESWKEDYNKVFFK